MPIKSFIWICILPFLATVIPAGRASASIILGTAGNFAVLGASTVTNTGNSTINGDLGVAPGTSITGTGTMAITGTIHDNDAVAAQAQADATTAYNSLAGLAATQNLASPDLGGLTLGAGVYSLATSAQLTGTLTLNFGGASNQDIVFQIGTALGTASDAAVVIEGGNSSDAVYFQVGTSATLGNRTAFAGNILALSSITLDDAASIQGGRAIALNGAVTLIANTVANTVSIPEPSSIALLFLGLLGMLAYAIPHRVAGVAVTSVKTA